MKALGVGPTILDKRKIDTEAIAGVLRELDKLAVRRRASDLGRAIKKEHGVTLAIDFIEERLAKS